MVGNSCFEFEIFMKIIKYSIGDTYKNFKYEVILDKY